MAKESKEIRAWDKTPAGKADDKSDRKKGIKEGSKRDVAIDKSKMSAGKKKK